MTHPYPQPPAPPTPGPPPSPAAWKDADREHRRAMIIDLALHLLTDEGPDALTMRRVARELGVGAMTLYTYIDGQPGLHRAMVQRGFDIIHHNCATACETQQAQKAQADYAEDGSGGWSGGARAYVQFATQHPNLYRLMFDTPVDANDEQFDQLMHGGFQGLHTVVRERLEAQGLKGKLLDTETRKLAGRYWIALHGLATLAIAGRMQVLHGTLDEVLLHLLEAVAPTKG
ncbi:TetR/AcrR family transcriptional regulator [Phycisphaeraceae bacterium D3-23]